MVHILEKKGSRSTRAYSEAETTDLITLTHVLNGTRSHQHTLRNTLIIAPKSICGTVVVISKRKPGHNQSQNHIPRVSFAYYT